LEGGSNIQRFDDQLEWRVLGAPNGQLSVEVNKFRVYMHQVYEKAPLAAG
jgi:hypothetical protein